VQDDDDDWAREASLMSMVYYNAFVTISATASKSGDEGLFRKCPEFEVRVDSKYGEGSKFVIHKERLHLDKGRILGLRQELPLNDRAWSMQERLLSPRVLHFTHEEMVLECLTEHRCECSGVRDVGWKSYIKAPKMRLRTGVSDLDSRGIWKGIVMQYSHRKLTYQKDKLVAIAGLARRFAKLGDRYLAGLWESTLVGQLEWEVRHTYQNPIKTKPAWRAPSWSWAAVDSPITYYGASDELEFSAFPGHHATKAEIIHCQVVPKTRDEYGELVSGRLKLLGRCTSVRWVAEDPNLILSNQVVFPNGYYRDFWLDTLNVGTPAKDCDIVCVLLRATSSYCTSLVLRRLESGIDIFERIGLLRGIRMDVDNLFPDEKIVVEIV
jgi:hypothetical protein